MTEPNATEDPARRSVASDADALSIPQPAANSTDTGTEGGANTATTTRSRPGGSPGGSRRRRDPVPFLFAFGVLVLGASAYWLFGPLSRFEQQAANDTPPPATETSPQAQQVQKASPAPAPQPAPSSVAPQATPPALATAPITAPRALAEEQSPPASPVAAPQASQVELNALRQRLDALEQRLSHLSVDTNDQKALTARITALETGLSSQVDMLNRQLHTAEQAAAQVQQQVQRATQLTRLQQAAAALDAGRALGTWPDQPTALARFAQQAPPTEAQLRLSYPSAAEAARVASRPDVAGRPFFNRLWARARQAVTIRDGNHVLVGDPAAGVLQAAHGRLEAGDLAAAVATLDELDPSAAQAMAEWRSQAQAVLNARAALATAEAQD